MLDLLRTTMGWSVDPGDADFLVWKHQENAFGPSPTWVAVHEERVVAVRAFLRWEFVHQGRVVRAVRAVDTATHPDYQGRGLFSRLTLHALGELRDDGVALVFNTPNERSLPGYLKLGWRHAGKLKVWVRPRRLASLVTMAQSRGSAERWSPVVEVGQPAGEVFADHREVEDLLASLPAGPEMRTHRTPAFLAWRYGFAPLGYRVLLAGPRLADGVVVFRLRRRGRAIEAVVADSLDPDPKVATTLLRKVAGLAEADYAIRLGNSWGPDRFLPLPGQGPTLAWRVLGDAAAPPPTEWCLSLGDVELF